MLVTGLRARGWLDGMLRIGVRLNALRTGEVVMPGDLYDRDILAWSEHQAGLLRRVAAGEPVNEAPDWTNIVEEVESVGNEQVHAVTSLLRQALTHMLKAEAWPLYRDAPIWRADAINFRQQAADRFAPSMRQRVNLERLYRQALHAVPETMDGQPPLPVPQTCPVTLDELLSDDIV